MGWLSWRGGAAGAVAILALGGSLLAWRSQTTTVTRTAATQAANVLDGATLFRVKGCVVCHDGPDSSSTIGVAPDLSNLAEVAGDRIPAMSAEEYVADSIRNPEAFVVPGFTPLGPGQPPMPSLDVSDEEIDALVVYLLAN